MSQPQNFDIIFFIKTQFQVVGRKEGGLSYELFTTKRAQILGLVRMAYPDTTDEMDEVTLNSLYDTARKEFTSVYPIDIDPSASLVKEQFKTWLTPARRSTMRRDYSERYLSLLRLEGRSEKVIAETDRSSEEILEKMGDPHSDAGFYCKGLVVGNVQSGKTGNFNAVINKAIDAGYSLIIVLSGIMEDLRCQTQERIDKDVVGEGVVDKITGRKGDLGVGRIKRFGERGDQSVRQVIAITSYRSDFKQTVKNSDFTLNNKNILVCKKNPGVLKNLLIWLSEYLQENSDKHSIPLLIIDDEADNASLNNLGHKGKEFASAINGNIRAILNLFSRKTYLGYTATPFANVLQDRNQTSPIRWKVHYKHNGEDMVKEFDQVDNIFPDDFIQLLIPPSNYIGAKHIFETVLDDTIRKLPLVVQVDDSGMHFPSELIISDDGTKRPATENNADEDIVAASKYDPYPDALPASLEDAVLCFIISIAIRLSRKPEMINSRLYNPHHTMLVHVSRFIPWQTRTRDLIAQYVKRIETRILNDLPGASRSVYQEFKQIWNKYFAGTMKDIRSYLPAGYHDEFLVPMEYIELEPLLITAVTGIEIKAVNSQTKEKLEYIRDVNGNGKKYIAVGGNRLSRGFTLEGLTINYFIRNTSYADTLLQMGRWFGYRPGYIDCCRLFTTSDAIEKFDSTTRVIEELEAEFLKMDREHKSPRDYLLRVRKDPGTLQITRPAILKNTKEVNWSYQDKLVQTTRFHLQPQKISDAWTDFKSFVKKYQHRFVFDKDKRFFTLDCTYDVLDELLHLRNTFYKYGNDISQIGKFIEKCLEIDKLTKWTIAIKATGNAREVQQADPNFPFKLRMTQRSGPDEKSKYRTDFISKQIFSVSGKSANIITAGSDLAVSLSPLQIKEAESRFRDERIRTLAKKKNIDVQAAALEVDATAVSRPERIYRESMSDEEGLAIIYIQDPEYIFGKGSSDSDTALEEMVSRHGYNLNIPVIGLAIGFPPVFPDPGGEYVIGKQWEENEEEEEEFDEDLQMEE